jgi:hypothetical protein
MGMLTSYLEINMVRRPKADLGAITVPKDTPSPSDPVHADQSSGLRGHQHTLSLRLTTDDYRALRRYVVDEEERTGRRITHQSVLESLLRSFLAEQRKR